MIRKSDSLLKRFLPHIIAAIFGFLLFMSVLGMELSMHFNIYGFQTLSTKNLMRILSDTFFVPSVFILGTAVLGLFKYLDLGAILYSAFTSIRQLVTLGFIPKGCRKAYRRFRKETKEEKGTGMAEMLIIGLALLAVAIILLIIYKNF